jgi:hypothetical protein
MDLGIPINKVIHEAIEIAVQTQLRSLIRDISTTLGKDSAPLLKTIASKTVSYYSYSEQDDDAIDLSERKCPHYKYINDSYITKCNEPIVWGKNMPNACIKHLFKPFQTNVKLPVLHLLNDMYIDMINGYVYNLEQKLIGRYNNNRVLLFDVI